jgi:branched-chain amino acid transport system permease protein
VIRHAHNGDDFEMYFFLQIALSGIATGAIYGLIAVGYSLTFMTTKALNFGLGMWVMLGGMLTYSLNVQYGIHPLIVLPIVMVALFALGLVAERFSVYPFLRAGSDVWVMSTLAVGFLMIDLAEIIWGRNPTPVPPFFGKDPVYLVHSSAAIADHRGRVRYLCWARFFLSENTAGQGVPRRLP